MKYLSLYLLFCMAFTLTASADWMGDYYPIFYENSWTLENRESPYDSYTKSVFEIIQYEGFTAKRVGRDISNHSISQTDGQTLTLFALVDEGLLIDFEENIELGEFDDGYMFSFCVDTECDTSFVRIWGQLDPSLKSIYEIDPEVTDLIVIASYDRDYNGNLHNIVLSSNLPAGVTPPTGAVTGIEWFRYSVGPYADLDVDAESGGMEAFYFLQESTVSVDESTTPHILTCYPNPFSHRTRIEWRGHIGSAQTLRIHDSSGRLVRSVSSFSPGFAWEGNDQKGIPLPSGTYFYHLGSGASAQVHRVILLR